MVSCVSVDAVWIDRPVPSLEELLKSSLAVMRLDHIRL